MQRVVPAAVFLAALLPAPVWAATVSLTVTTVSASADQPSITIENLSDDGSTLAALNLSIGDDSYNFDRVTNRRRFGVASARLTKGGSGQAGQRTDAVAFAFSGFDPGDSFRFRAEMDPDAGSGSVDFRSVFFGNDGTGAVPNAAMTALFNDDRSVTASFREALAPAETYTLVAADDDPATPVPLPVAVPALATALGALWFIAGRAGRS